MNGGGETIILLARPPSLRLSCFICRYLVVVCGSALLREQVILSGGSQFAPGRMERVLNERCAALRGNAMR